MLKTQALSLCFDSINQSTPSKGPPVTQERGCAVADGEIDPITGEVFAEMAGNKGNNGGEKGI